MKRKIIIAILAVCLIALAGFLIYENFAEPPIDEENSVRLPIIMYHQLSGTEGNYLTISPDGFREQLQCIKDNGYTPVSPQEIIDYVYDGKDLPEKPVYLTFDDGYSCNYEYAYPILKEFDFKATIFPIASTVGMERYKDTQHKIIPHFTTAEMREMHDSGLISFQSHTYDMHQWEPFEIGDIIRTNILKLDTETDEEYAAVLKADHAKVAQVLAAAGIDELNTVSYPGGMSAELTESILKELGVKMTFTTDSTIVNILTKNDYESLYDLGRIGMDRFPDSASLKNYLDTYGK